MGWFRRKAPLEPAPAYDAALAAPVPVATPEPGGPGVYNVVYRSPDSDDTRTKSLWADNPHQAKDRADAHEAEYCELTGAPKYFYDRIDYPKEQQNQ